MAGQRFPNLTGWVQIHLECVLACTCYLAIVLYKGLAYIDPHKALLPPMGEQQELQFSSSPLYDTQWHTSSYSPTTATPSADEFMPFVFVPHPHCVFFCVCMCLEGPCLIVYPAAGCVCVFRSQCRLEIETPLICSGHSCPPDSAPLAAPPCPCLAGPPQWVLLHLRSTHTPKTSTKPMLILIVLHFPYNKYIF